MYRFTNQIIELLHEVPVFTYKAQAVTAATIARDCEDDIVLQQGIDYSVAQGVLPPLQHNYTVTDINVESSTPQEVTQNIFQRLNLSAKGILITIQGLSGTGKGTTAETLLQLIPNSKAWSNGDIFRSVTYLSLKYPEQPISVLMTKLAFVEKHKNNFDIRIDDTYWLADIKNTELKGKEFSTKIPGVASRCQGEVILFAQKAIQQLQTAGFNIIQEGRAATLNYFATPYKFNLILKNMELIGQRRLAQTIAAKCKDQNVAPLSEAELKQELEKILETVN